MFKRSISFVAFIGLVGIACEKPKEETQAEQKVEPVAAPAPEPAAEPEPAASAAPEVQIPGWVNDYADALCKRVAVCREKLIAGVGPQQKMMVAMQIPTQEACMTNTLAFKTSPKPELDASEQKLLDKCIKGVPATACGDVQTGKVPECAPLVELLKPYRGEEDSAGAQ